jgi:hypothetical protein
MRATSADWEFVREFDNFLGERGMAFDKFCDLYQRVFSSSAEQAANDDVRICLEAAAEQIGEAGMSWYVSTK